MMEAVFFRSILEQPDDEVVRLAFADWLMEQDDPDKVARGEFIQIQCQLARRADGRSAWEAFSDTTARLPELQKRERELLARHGDDWSRAVRKVVDRATFHRGFVEEVALPGTAFPQVADELFKLAPIRRVRLTGGIWPVRALAACPELEQVVSLDLSGIYLGDAGVQALLASPHLDNLTELNLSGGGLSDRGLQTLANSSLLGRLRNLDLSANRFTVAGVRSLIESPHWTGQCNLHLANNPRIGREALESLGAGLAGTPDPSMLRTLLQMCSDREYDYSNAHVRDLAARAGDDPARAVPVLIAGLGDARRKIRSASAQMLARLGSAAAPAVPALVQRLGERTPLVRAHVAPALARLLPDLPEGLQRWLCLLANPLRSPGLNLRGTLESPHLSAPLPERFAELCARRAEWWQRTRGREGARAPATGPRKTTPRALWQTAEALAALAALACRGGSPDARERAAEKEYAWLLGRLCALVQQG
jgi:uncharacterized protein (TIGR02996 family)